MIVDGDYTASPPVGPEVRREAETKTLRINCCVDVAYTLIHHIARIEEVEPAPSIVIIHSHQYFDSALEISNWPKDPLSRSTDDRVELTGIKGILHTAESLIYTSS